MHIRIILPSFYDEHGKLVKAKKAFVPCVTLRYLAAMVPNHHRVSVVEESVEDINFDEKVDLAGITVQTFSAERAYDVAAEYRKRGVPVALGGIHVTAVPDEAALHADAIVVGEAEDTWPELIEDFEKSALKKRYEKPARDSLKDLPHPRFDLIDPQKYILSLFNPMPLIPIQTGRGCSHDCDFCATTKFYGAKIRHRPIEDIIAEIKYSKGNSFFFVDDNLTADYHWAREFFSAVKPLHIKFHCQMDTLIHTKPELVELAAEGGCFHAYVGFESQDPKVLKSVNKRFNQPEEYKSVFRLLNKYHIACYASFIVGFDDDTLEGIEYTVNFLIEQKAAFGAFFPLCPFPGTPLYQRLKNDHRLFFDDWWLHRREFGEKINHIGIKYADNQTPGYVLSNHALHDFYSYSSIGKRFLPPRRNTLFSFLANIDINHRLRSSFLNVL
ncbi:MAG: radical SAM protein [Verrucomicrobiota bacterium]|jgi:radical SAM superfamily enzyme YgiQ (UPF0313 family)